jgi:hypothetical protein
LCGFGALAGASLWSAAQARPARPLTVTRGYTGACAAAPAPGRSRLWLGHFRGGDARKIWAVAPPKSIITVAWADRYACFSSRRLCEAWQAELRHVHRGIYSTRTCLPLR